jgi:hypothetical protein
MINMNTESAAGKLTARCGRSYNSNGGVMKEMLSRILVAILLVAAWLAVAPGGFFVGHLSAKDKQPSLDPNDPTYRLYQLLDNKRGGKLSDFYVIADVYNDPKNPNIQQQHILMADYDRNRAFGKLNLYVRSVGKISSRQMETYTPKEFYEFGLMDLEKFMKTDPGPLGKPGDIYLRAHDDEPLHSTEVTDAVRKEYDVFLTQYLLPALEKQ